MSELLLKDTEVCILKTMYFNQLYINIEQFIFISIEFKTRVFEYLFLIHINQIPFVLKLATHSTLGT